MKNYKKIHSGSPSISRKLFALLLLVVIIIVYGLMVREIFFQLAEKRQEKRAEAPAVVQNEIPDITPDYPQTFQNKVHGLVMSLDEKSITIQKEGGWEKFNINSKTSVYSLAGNEKKKSGLSEIRTLQGVEVIYETASLNVVSITIENKEQD